MSRALALLLRLLDLEDLGDGRFRAFSESEERPHVFGGQLAAQALAAAGTTSRNLPAHSVHANFLRRGDPNLDVVYRVDCLREGSRAATRLVTASQEDRVIATLVASFREPREGIVHAEPMPPVAGPDHLPSMREQAEQCGHALPPAIRHWLRREGPVDLRVASGPGMLQGDRRKGPVRLWMRATGELPDDPLLHQCVATYALDLGPIEAALRQHVEGFILAEGSAISLDHCIWFNRPFRIDRWLLDCLESPVAAGGRAFVRGSVFNADGTHLASLAQELAL